MIPVAGPFLLLGVIAWVVAIVMGVGAWFGLTTWRDRWAIAGALAGFGTFQLYLHAHGGLLPVLIPTAAMALPATAGLFVGCGIAAAYGTLFANAIPARPTLPPGSAEEMLWLNDTLDRFRPRRADWLLAGLLLAPGGGMLYLGLGLGSGVEFVTAGVVSLLGPIFGAAGLALRRRAAHRYRVELDEREPAVLTPATSPSGFPPAPTRTG